MEIARNLQLTTVLQGKLLFTTIFDDYVSSLAGEDVGTVTPCTHEEAYKRIFLHVHAAASAGHNL